MLSPRVIVMSSVRGAVVIHGPPSVRRRHRLYRPLTRQKPWAFPRLLICSNRNPGVNGVLPRILNVEAMCRKPPTADTDAVRPALAATSPPGQMADAALGFGVHLMTWLGPHCMLAISKPNIESELSYAYLHAVASRVGPPATPGLGTTTIAASTLN